MCTVPSKTFNLAGLQTSTIIIPNKTYYEIYKNFMTRIHLLRNNAFGLVALEAAYTHGEEWLYQFLEYLDGNLKTLIKGIEKDIPQIKIVKPEGTYLVWMDCRDLNLDSKQLNDFMINKARLALDDGYWFGIGGEGFQRINLACPRVYINKALTQLKKAIAEF